jgi:hypothetical protein
MFNLNKKQCCQFFNKQYNLLNGVGSIRHHQILVVIQRTLPDLKTGSHNTMEKERLVAALLYLSYFTRFVVVNYCSLEKKKVTIRRGGQDKPDRSARFVWPAPPPV